jgi:hypothetical protein
MTKHRAEHILEDVFAFFDTHPDVPYIILNSHDGMESRDINRSPNTPELLKDGYYIPEMPDASALFVLARRERIDAVRKFAYDDAPPEDSVDDLNTYGVARRLYLAYDELMRAVPHPDKKKIRMPLRSASPPSPNGCPSPRNSRGAPTSAARAASAWSTGFSTRPTSHPKNGSPRPGFPCRSTRNSWRSWRSWAACRPSVSSTGPLLSR